MAEITTNVGALIPITESNGKRAVSARALYDFLGCTERFQSWFDRQLQYGFDENKDYVGCKVFNTLANQELQDYAMALSMAKEVSMIQRSEKGKQARRYFIACEERLKESKSISQSRPSSVTPTKVRAGIEWVKGVSEMLNLNDVSKLSLLEKVATPLGLPLPDYVPSKGVMKSATDLLNEKGYKVSRNQFYKRAIELGYIERISRKSSKGKIIFQLHIQERTRIRRESDKQEQPEGNSTGVVCGQIRFSYVSIGIFKDGGVELCRLKNTISRPSTSSLTRLSIHRKCANN